MDEEKKFYRVNMRLLSQSLMKMDKRYAAMAYIFNNINRYTNIVFGSIDEMVEETGVKKYTISRSLKNLEDKNLVKKIGSRMWMVNPEAYYNGDPNDYNEILREYNAS